MSTELTITGSIKKFLPVERGIAKASGKEWQKQNFIVSNNDGYEGKEQIFCFEVFGGEKVENLSKFQKEGDNVKVSFNIGTNEWNGKYFTSLSAWRIDKLEGTQEEEGQQEFPPEESIGSTDVDDLPF